MTFLVDLLMPKRPPRGEREPGLSTMAIAEVPFKHERNRDAFEPWALRPVIHTLHPVITHVTDEGDPHWEVWFVHNNRPVVLAVPSPGVGELSMDDLTEYLSKSVSHERQGTASADELRAARFARRVREMVCLETWPEPQPPTI
jgi:hypothetical protein